MDVPLWLTFAVSDDVTDGAIIPAIVPIELDTPITTPPNLCAQCKIHWLQQQAKIRKQINKKNLWRNYNRFVYFHKFIMHSVLTEVLGVDKLLFKERN